MSNVSIGVTVSISDQTLIDMLDAAGYGIGYWASSMEVDEEGKKVKVTEHDESVHEFDFDRVRWAFGQLAQPRQQHVNKQLWGYFMAAVAECDEKTREIDAGYIDSDAGDCLVQLAALGEIVYG
jgi:hypothetical protein